MKFHDSEQQWLREFNEFMSGDSGPVPEKVNHKILRHIHREMFPAGWLVFGKLFSIQSISGTFSLALCDQFGINPFRTGFSLSDYFMTFGHSACMFLCGFLFIGVGVSLGRFLLRTEELLVIRKNLLLQIFTLSLLFLGIFAMLGAEFTLTIGFLWVLGAMLGGVISTIFPWHKRINSVG